MTSFTRAVEQRRSGVYRVKADREDLAHLEAITRRARLALHRVTLPSAAQKPEILEALARELRFPDWFGQNWDALQDTLCDLSWLPESRGIVLVIDGVDATRAAPGVLETFIDVLRSAAQHWERAKRPFLVLVAGQGRLGLPSLR